MVREISARVPVQDWNVRESKEGIVALRAARQLTRRTSTSTAEAMSLPLKIGMFGGGTVGGGERGHREMRATGFFTC